MTHLCQMMAQVRILLKLPRFLLGRNCRSRFAILRPSLGVLVYKSNDKAVVRHSILCKFIIFCVILHLSIVSLRNNLYICID